MSKYNAIYRLDLYKRTESTKLNDRGTELQKAANAMEIGAKVIWIEDHSLIITMRLDDPQAHKKFGNHLKNAQSLGHFCNKNEQSMFKWTRLDLHQLPAGAQKNLCLFFEDNFR